MPAKRRKQRFSWCFLRYASPTCVDVLLDPRSTIMARANSNIETLPVSHAVQPAGPSKACGHTGCQLTIPDGCCGTSFIYVLDSRLISYSYSLSVSRQTSFRLCWSDLSIGHSALRQLLRSLQTILPSCAVNRSVCLRAVQESMWTQLLHTFSFNMLCLHRPPPGCCLLFAGSHLGWHILVYVLFVMPPFPRSSTSAPSYRLYSGDYCQDTESKQERKGRVSEAGGSRIQD